MFRGLPDGAGRARGSAACAAVRPTALSGVRDRDSAVSLQAPRKGRRAQGALRSTASPVMSLTPAPAASTVYQAEVAVWYW